MVHDNEHHTCIICCLAYNVTTRRPFDLGCGHCVCEQCFNTSKFAICVECRQPINNPHLQYTLLRMLQPTSPTSFPIGCPAGCVIEDVDDAPGTPHPSAPVMEVELWDPSDDSSSGSSSDASSRRASGIAHTSSSSSAAGGSIRSIGSHRLSHQTNAKGSSASGSTVGTSSRSRQQQQQQPPAQAAATAPAVVGPDTGEDAVALRALAITTTATMTTTATWTAAAAAVGTPQQQQQQLVSHQLLTSFPVEDLDLLELRDDTSNSSSSSILDGLGQEGSVLGAAVEGGAAGAAAVEEGPSPGGALAALQSAVGGCMGLVQQLMLQHMLFEQQQQQQQQLGGRSRGWPYPGPSLLLAITSSCWRTWAAYSSAVAATLRHCQQLQSAAVDSLGRTLSRCCGLHNAGHLAAYVLATWLLGLLLYHWQLGLALLPVAAAALALVAFGSMPGSSGCCLLWPAKLAGAVLAGDCLVLGLLGIALQHISIGAAAALHAQLLAATPQVLLLALLLLWGQVAMEVLGQGWATYRELCFVSLVVRCWTVAAAAVLTTGPAAAALAAAVPWVQKVHLLLEGPVVVHHIGLLLRPSSTCWAPQQQQRGPAAESSRRASTSSIQQQAGSSRAAANVPSTATAGSVGSSGNGTMSAWLLCVHCLLQLLLVLFVPPAPLAAVGWLPLLLRGSLVWSVRVLLCGCSVQLFLQLLPPVTSSSTVSSAAVAAAVAPAGGSSAASVGWSRPSSSSVWLHEPAAAADSCWRSCSPSRCGQPSSSGSSSMLLPAAPMSPGSSCWQMQLHGSSGCSSHALGPVAAGGFGASSSLFALHGGTAGGLTAGSGVLSVAAGAVLVMKQHAAYLALLLLAAAGDSFIMAVPSAAAVGVVRAAWHVCVQQMLVVMFVVEIAAALWREVQLLRHQQYVVAARHHVGQRGWSGVGVGGGAVAGSSCAACL